MQDNMEEPTSVKRDDYNLQTIFCEVMSYLIISTFIMLKLELLFVYLLTL